MDENHDPLTGLWNAKWAHEKLANLVGQSRQVALLFIDVDHMKLFNDTFGHDRGDEQLVRIARQLEKTCGPNSIVSRCGGDEFWVILNETSLETALEIAENIRASHQSVRLPLHNGELAETLTFSIGLAHYPTQVSSSDSLIRAADVCVIKCKKCVRLTDGSIYTKRNRVMTFGDFTDEFPEQSAKFLNEPK